MPLAIRLAAAAAVALLTLLATRHCLPAGALLAVLGIAVSLRGASFRPGLAALPAMLAAMAPPPDPGPAPPRGPVAIAGEVLRVRRDPAADEFEVWIRTAGGPLRLVTGTTCRPLPGDRLTATARCSAPAVVGGAPRLRAEAAAVQIAPGPWSVQRTAAALRLALEDRLLDLVPGEAGALVCSLVLGSATRLPEDLAAAHRATGLSHLLAVSGAHAAMLAWLLGLHPFGRHRRIGRLHLLLGLGALTGYAVLTGLEPPVFRALCSYGLLALAHCTNRRIGVVQMLGWPALASVVVAPDGALGASFWLSYAAVAGLALAARAPRRPRRGGLEWIRGPVRASFWATATTAPLTLGWFGQLAPWTVLLTPILAPLVAALLFLGLGAGVAGLLAPALAADVLAPVLRLLAAIYGAFVQAADVLPGTPVLAPIRPKPVWIGIGAGLGALVVLALRSRRSVLFACALGGLPHFLAPAVPEPPGLHLLAIGHGQACLVRTPDGAQIVVDCGSVQHPVLPARKLELLLRRRRIELLVLTHGDHDHVGAVPALLARARIASAVLPGRLRGHAVAELLQGEGAALHWLAPGERLELRNVVITAPDPGADSSGNDASLWVRCDLGGTTALLPGDAEERGIAAALSIGAAEPCDVLVLPHHGHANLAADALLQITGPRVCLVSNRHGEGISELGSTAARRGIPTFSTGDCGDLHVLGGEVLLLHASAGLRMPGRPPALATRPP